MLPHWPQLFGSPRTLRHNGAQRRSCGTQSPTRFGGHGGRQTSSGPVQTPLGVPGRSVLRASRFASRDASSTGAGRSTGPRHRHESWSTKHRPTSTGPGQRGAWTCSAGQACARQTGPRPAGTRTSPGLPELVRTDALWNGDARPTAVLRMGLLGPPSGRPGVLRRPERPPVHTGHGRTAVHLSAARFRPKAGRDAVLRAGRPSPPGLTRRRSTGPSCRSRYR